MTSASELFNNRRYRFGRNSVDFGDFDSSTESPNVFSRQNRRHHNNNHHHHHHHHRGGGRSHRHEHERHDLERHELRRSATQIPRTTYLEREAVGLHQGIIQSIPGNSNSDNVTSLFSGEIFARNNRLPGDVLLARERLIERLRGVSPSGQRESNRASSSMYLDDLASRRNIRVNRHMLAEVNYDMASFLAFQATKSRPPGLTQDALDHLHIEAFTNAEKGDGDMSKGSLECSICLENFVEGAELVRLPCGHRYHSCCLDPWVRTCGDCPYCRAAIKVTDYKSLK